LLFVADKFVLDPWQFLSIEESIVPSTKTPESPEEKVGNIVSSQRKPADRNVPQVSMSVYRNISQLVSANVTTSNSSVLSKTEAYSGWKKEESSYFPVLNQQQLPPQEKFACPLGCGKLYSQNKNLQYHMKYECGKEPRFQCPYCPHRTKRKNNLMLHISSQHAEAHNASLRMS
jgi:hypothetical protein